jgi:CO dehydrogenase maturation factor
MKLAISGKGGVGKKLLTALLTRAFVQAGYTVTAIDADPDANLGLTLGFPDTSKIIPLAEMKELIQERTETRPGQTGPYFKINPTVDDIPSKYSIKLDGVRLLVMGRPRAGGAGCYCPENAVLSALIAHLLLSPGEVVIMDMAAGIEHLNRGTARAVDRLVIVVEPGKASIETARRIISLARDLGIRETAIVGNKVRNREEKDFITGSFRDYNILGFLPYDPALTRAELAGESKLDASPAVKSSALEIFKQLTAAE